VISITTSGADLKPYKNKEWLENQINVLGKTQAQVARECGVAQGTISYQMRTPARDEKIKEYRLKNYNKEYNKQYRLKNKDRLKEYKKIYSKKYYEINSEKIKERAKEYGTIYKKENKEKIKIKNRIYSENNKDKRKEYREKNKEKLKEYKKEYYQKNKDLGKQKEYREKNRERIKVWRNNSKNEHNAKRREKRKERKINVFNMLGGCKCVMCEENRVNRLTIDHINKDGFLDRKRGFRGSSMYDAIATGKITQEELKNLRVLCWNHNDGERRSYYDKQKEDQTAMQRVGHKLYKEAFLFFGPCSCGQKDLKFLTISHIHNDGAECRRNGEKTGVQLLMQFRALVWPESLKEKYCLECFNCNCSRGNRDE
jgi:hypothetical protein